MAKFCRCSLTLKNCQCFRYFLNNGSVEHYLRRKKKTIHNALFDFKIDPPSKKVIGIIIYDSQNFVDEFSFEKHFRKNCFLKIIVLKKTYQIK